MDSFYVLYEGFGDAVNALSNRMDISSLKLQQVAAEIPFPAIFGFIPWGHHIEIIIKCKNLHEALFYVQRTIEESADRSWSMNSTGMRRQNMDQMY